MTALGAYFGNSTADLASYEAWIGQDVDHVLFYLNDWSWKDFDSSIGWAAGLWKPSGAPVMWSVPLTVWGTSLEQVATGAFNEHFLKAAQTLAKSTPSADGSIYVRVGWEFNGGWMPWAAQGREAAFIEAFQELVTVFRSVSSDFKFVWDVNAGGSMDPASAYPGDAFVDVVGMDFYYDKQWDSADPAKAFAYEVSQRYGLQWQQDFAAAHGKETAISEWGVQTDDAAAYISAAAKWMSDHDMLFQNYWESDYANFKGTLHDGTKPNAAAAFLEAFIKSQQGGPAPAPGESGGEPVTNAPTAIELSAAALPENSPAGTIVGSFSTTDADADDIFIYRLLDDAGGRFTLSGSTLTVANGLLLDFEQSDSASISVRVTDSQGHSFEKTFSIAVTDVDPEVVTGSSAADTIRGGRGADRLSGADGADTLFGGAGADILDGGSGKDVMHGGLGDDWYMVDHAGDRVIDYAGEGKDTVFTSVNYTLAAGQEIERFYTTDDAGTAALRLTGNEFRNTLKGNAGANILDGGGGVDVMTGLDGNDVYYVDNAGDLVVEAANGGDDLVLSDVTYVLRAGQEIERLYARTTAATTALKLIGNEFANVIKGNAGANTLDGGGGADVLSGLSGNDLYLVDDAADIVVEAAGGGTDTVKASVNYKLASAQEIERLYTNDDAGTAPLNLTGNGFANTLRGNAGANILDGGGGVDVMTGLGGHDTYYVDSSSDLVIEAAGGGTDTVLGDISYVLRAGQEIEQLYAKTAAGTVALNFTGNEFANAIRGNAGANVIDGGAGSDVLTGLGGRDTFVFSTTLGPTNIDRITDFSVLDDTIRLSKSVFGGLPTGALNQAAFKDIGVAGAVVDDTDRILYDRGSGALFFDADGSGQGLAIQFAILDDTALVTHANFIVV